MAQADCLPTATRAVITGANRNSSTLQNALRERDLARSNAVPLVTASCRTKWRLA